MTSSKVQLRNGDTQIDSILLDSGASTGALTLAGQVFSIVSEGQLRTLTMNGAVGTSAGGNIIFAALIPVGSRPVGDITQFIPVSDNSVTVLGSVEVFTNGDVVFGVGPTRAAFAGTNNAGFSAYSITYSIQLV